MNYQKRKQIIPYLFFFLTTPLLGEVVCDSNFFTSLIQKKISNESKKENVKVRFLSPYEICGERNSRIHLEKHPSYDMWVLITMSEEGKTLRFPVEINIQKENQMNVIQKGDSLFMVFHDPRIKSIMKVKSIENGRIGKVIQVQNSDKNIRYWVKVISFQEVLFIRKTSQFKNEIKNEKKNTI